MHILLNNRGLIKIDGPDARAFLQGLVSQDMQRVSPHQAVYSAFLSPQGKFLFDFFCFEMDGTIILDCEAERCSDFFKRLSMYKMRSKVELSDVSDDYQIFAVMSAASAFDLMDQPRGTATPFASGVAFVDPRLKDMGCRAVLKKGDKALTFAGLSSGEIDDYESNRITLGLADGSRDMSVDKALLLENGFEELDGVSFTKGCFMGQELTARTRYRGLVKKRLLPVKIEGQTPMPGSILMNKTHEAGEMKTSIENMGLALVRLEQLEDGAPISYGNTKLTPMVPDWVVFQDQNKDKNNA